MFIKNNKIHFYIFAPDGLIAVYENKNGMGKMYYTATDNLGSINLIVDGTSGDIVSDLSYDAWGRNRNPYDWTYDNISLSSITDRGYTGHEHMTAFNLINMNGRAYDPYTSQFLSPDPFVQDPANPQNYNRYSYVLNNPLKFTDPSGYNFQVYDSNYGCFRDENAYTGFAGWYNWYHNLDQYRDGFHTYGGQLLGIGSAKDGLFSDGFYASSYGLQWYKQITGKDLTRHNGQWGYWDTKTISGGYCNVLYLDGGGSYTARVFQGVGGNPPKIGNYNSHYFYQVANTMKWMGENYLSFNKIHRNYLVNYESLQNSNLFKVHYSFQGTFYYMPETQNYPEIQILHPSTFIYFNGDLYGRYDTLITKSVFIGSINAGWYGREVWFKIVDKNTIRHLCSRSFDSEEMHCFSLDTIENPPVRFVPLEKMPSSDCWLKREKWFWCNEEDWKNYMDSVYINKKK